MKSSKYSFALFPPDRMFGYRVSDIYFRKWYSLSVKGMLSTGPTQSSFFVGQNVSFLFLLMDIFDHRSV